MNVLLMNKNRPISDIIWANVGTVGVYKCVPWAHNGTSGGVFEHITVVFGQSGGVSVGRMSTNICFASISDYFTLHS